MAQDDSCPSKIYSEDGCFSCVSFSVDLSRRITVLLRRGPLRKGLGGINTYTVFLHPLSFSALELFLSYAWAYLRHISCSTALLRGSNAPAILPQFGATSTSAYF
jgi:hypothetical protein